MNGLTSRETVRSRIMDTMRHRNTTTMIELIKLNQCMRWKADVVSQIRNVAARPLTGSKICK